MTGVQESGFVSYKKNITNVLGLNIPLEDAVNRVNFPLEYVLPLYVYLSFCRCSSLGRE
jgi:hypothetical protein